MSFNAWHRGTLGGLLMGAGLAMVVEILKAESASPIVIGVAAIEVVTGAALIVVHHRARL